MTGVVMKGVTLKGLAIDTALGRCTAAVFDGAVVLAVRSEAMDRGHQERLGGLVRDAVAACGGFPTLDRIAVTIGPGSFTGLRVGMAFAQGLGAALDRPVVGLSTLDLLGDPALTPDLAQASASVALIDARRGQVYARFWCGGEPQAPAEALPLETAAERIARLPHPVLVGSGAALFADRFPELERRPLAGPTPEALARAAAVADPVVSPPRPLYLRAPDATPPGRAPGQPRIAAP